MIGWCRDPPRHGSTADVCTLCTIAPTPGGAVHTPKSSCQLGLVSFRGGQWLGPREKTGSPDCWSAAGRPFRVVFAVTEHMEHYATGQHVGQTGMGLKTSCGSAQALPSVTYRRGDPQRAPKLHEARKQRCCVIAMTESMHVPI